MKRIRNILSIVLCFAMLFSLTMVFNGLADPGALNGESGKWSQFDKGVYDVTVSSSKFKGTFEWPDSPSKVCVTASATSSSYTIAKFNGITIPANMIVDIYKYSSGDDTYTLLGHFDTTDGKAITIGKDTGSTGNSGSTSTSKPSNSDNSNSVNGIAEEWGKVEHVYTPGTPSASYSNSYTDVPTTYWAYHPIMTLTEGGLLAGYGNGKFGPNDTLTKEQVSIIYTRMIGNTPYPNGNQEVASRAYAAIWFTGRALTGQGNQYLTKYETQLAMDCGNLLNHVASNGTVAFGSMSRGIYDCWRANLAAGRTIDYIDSVDELPDADAIHAWIDANWQEMKSVLLLTGNYSKEEIVETCEDCICYAYNLGLMNGVDSNRTFAPNAPLTRGQLAQILYNMGWTYEGVLSYV